MVSSNYSYLIKKIFYLHAAISSQVTNHYPYKIIIASSNYFAQSDGAIEYTDCFSAEG